MTKPLALAALPFLFAPSLFASTLADWTFETSGFTSITNTGTAPLSTSIAPEVGSGSATGLHASSSTAWSAPTGNGSSRSLNSDHWAKGDYYQFSTTLDQADFHYSSLSLSFSQNGSTSGPKTFSLWYSTDNSTYVQFGSDYTLSSEITWTGSSHQGTQESFDLSSVTVLNNANSVYFRLIDDSPTTGGAINGGNVGTTGTDRVDDFSISGIVTPVPEPSLAALFGVAGVSWLLRRRKTN